jgi:hypothetical protein
MAVVKHQRPKAARHFYLFPSAKTDLIAPRSFGESTLLLFFLVQERDDAARDLLSIRPERVNQGLFS